AMPREDPAQTLKILFQAERTARSARDALADIAQTEPDTVVALLEQASRTAFALGDEDEGSLELVQIAELLGEMQGPRVVDLLIAILGGEDPDARRAAGEALSGLAFDRFKDVALGIERALVRLKEGSPALAELPYIIAEVPEPGVIKLLARFLAHRDADAVAAAIEAAVVLGDPSVLPLLERLAGDPRRVELEDEGGTEGDASLGELVAEARAILAKGGST
ncbi:MAG: HEAT repeat domain-containing protein, partial [Polyangiaceae bacterium]